MTGGEISGLDYGLNTTGGTADLTDVLTIAGGNYAIANQADLTLSVTSDKTIKITNWDEDGGFNGAGDALTKDFYGIYNTGGTLDIVSPAEDGSGLGSVSFSGRNVRPSDVGTAIWSNKGSVTIHNLVSSTTGADLDSTTGHLPGYIYMVQNSGTAVTDIMFNFAVASNAIQNSAILSLRGKETDGVYKGKIVAKTTDGVKVVDGAELKLYNVALESDLSDQEETTATAIITVDSGGTLYMENESQDTITLTPQSGSAIVNSGTVTINKVTVDGTKKVAVDGTPSVRFLTNKGGEATLIDVYVHDTSAATGGAIQIDGGTVHVTGTDTVYTHDGHDGIRGTLFESSNAVTNGGAVYVASGASFNAGGYVTFDSNTAADGSGNGGAIYNNGGDVKLTGTAGLKLTTVQFVNSEDKDLAANGGYLYNEAGSLTLNKVSLAGGKATDGGAIYGKGGTITIQSSYLGQYSEVDADGEITWKDAGNAAEHGGAIYNNGATINVYGNETATYILNNSADQGGAIYNESGSLTLSANTGTYRNVFIYENSARQGGAIYASGGQLSISHTSIDHNTLTGGADSEGSALYLSGNVRADIVNATIAYNGDLENADTTHAIYSAGPADSNDGKASLYIVNSTVSLNRGGLSLGDNADAYLVNSIFLNEGDNTLSPSVTQISSITTGDMDLVFAADSNKSKRWDSEAHILNLLDDSANPALKGVLVAGIEENDTTVYLYQNHAGEWMRLNDSPYSNNVAKDAYITVDQRGAFREPASETGEGRYYYEMGAVISITVETPFFVTTAEDNILDDDDTSLREAIDLVNSLGKGTIVFDMEKMGSHTITLDADLGALPELAEGVEIIIRGIDGQYNTSGAIVIDCSNITEPALTIDFDVTSAYLSDLKFIGSGTLVELTGNNNQVANGAVTFEDMTLTSTSGTNAALSVGSGTNLSVTDLAIAASGIALQNNANSLTVSGALNISTAESSNNFIGIKNQSNGLTFKSDAVVTITTASNSKVNGDFTGLDTNVEVTMEDGASLTVTNSAGASVSGTFTGVNYSSNSDLSVINSDVTISNKGEAGKFTALAADGKLTMNGDLTISSAGTVNELFQGVSFAGDAFTMNGALSIGNTGKAGAFTGVSLANTGDGVMTFNTPLSIYNRGDVTGAFTGVSNENSDAGKGTMIFTSSLSVENTGSAGEFTGINNVLSDTGNVMEIQGALTVMEKGTVGKMVGVNNAGVGLTFGSTVTITGGGADFTGIYNTGDLTTPGLVKISHSATEGTEITGIYNNGTFLLNGGAEISFTGAYSGSEVSIYGINNSGTFTIGDETVRSNVTVSGTFSGHMEQIPGEGGEVEAEYWVSAPVYFTGVRNDKMVEVSRNASLTVQTSHGSGSGRSQNDFYSFTGIDILNNGKLTQNGNVTVTHNAATGGYVIPSAVKAEYGLADKYIDNPFTGIAISSTGNYTVEGGTLKVEIGSNGSVNYNSVAYGISGSGSLNLDGGTINVGNSGYAERLTGINGVRISVADGATLNVSNSGVNTNFTGIDSGDISADGTVNIANNASVTTFTGIQGTLNIGEDGNVTVSNNNKAEYAFTGVDGTLTANGQLNVQNAGTSAAVTGLDLSGNNSIGEKGAVTVENTANGVGSFTGAMQGGDLSVDGSLQISNAGILSGAFSGIVNGRLGAGGTVSLNETAQTVIQNTEQAVSFTGFENHGELSISGTAEGNRLAITNEAAIGAFIGLQNTAAVTLAGNMSITNSGAFSTFTGISNDGNNKSGSLKQTAGTVSVSNTGAGGEITGILNSAGTTDANGFEQIGGEIKFVNSGISSGTVAGIVNSGSFLSSASLTINNDGGAETFYAVKNNTAAKVVFADGVSLNSSNTAAVNNYIGIENSGTFSVEAERENSQLNFGNTGAVTNYVGIVNSGDFTAAGQAKFDNNGSSPLEQYIGVSNSGIFTSQDGAAFEFSNSVSAPASGQYVYVGIQNSGTANINGGTVAFTNSGTFQNIVGVDNSDTGTFRVGMNGETTNPDTWNLSVTNTAKGVDKFTGISNAGTFNQGALQILIDNSTQNVSNFYGLENLGTAVLSGGVLFADANNNGVSTVSSQFAGIYNMEPGNLTLSGTHIPASVGSCCVDGDLTHSGFEIRVDLVSNQNAYGILNSSRNFILEGAYVHNIHTGLEDGIGTGVSTTVPVDWTDFSGKVAGFYLALGGDIAFATGGDILEHFEFDDNQVNLLLNMYVTADAADAISLNAAGEWEKADGNPVDGYFQTLDQALGYANDQNGIAYSISFQLNDYYYETGKGQAPEITVDWQDAATIRETTEISDSVLSISGNYFGDRADMNIMGWHLVMIDREHFTSVLIDGENESDLLELKRLLEKTTMKIAIQVNLNLPDS